MYLRYRDMIAVSWIPIVYPRYNNNIHVSKENGKSIMSTSSCRHVAIEGNDFIYAYTNLHTLMYSYGRVLGKIFYFDLALL